MSQHFIVNDTWTNEMLLCIYLWISVYILMYVKEIYKYHFLILDKFYGFPILIQNLLVNSLICLLKSQSTLDVWELNFGERKLIVLPEVPANTSSQLRAQNIAFDNTWLLFHWICTDKSSHIILNYILNWKNQNKVNWVSNLF